MAKLKLGTREAILAARDIQTEQVDIPEWSCSVLVRGMSGVDRDAFESSLLKGKGRGRDINLANFRARLVSRSVVDEAGNLVFSEHDAEALGRHSAGALSRISDVAQRLSGVTPEDVEELVGESVAAPGDGSSTA